MCDQATILSGKLTKQECIPVGCVPPAAVVAITRAGKGTAWTVKSLSGGLCPSFSVTETYNPLTPCEQNDTHE